jgi:hypothetical protein
MTSKRTYTASQGEAWDQAARSLWGQERLMHKLWEANPQYREVVFFSGGEILQVPQIEIVPSAGKLPPWKQKG